MPNFTYYVLHAKAHEYDKEMKEAIQAGHEPQGAPMLYRQQRGDSPNCDYVYVAQAFRFVNE